MSGNNKLYLSMPDVWVEDADSMGLSNSEWARRMIRSGRRQWGFDHVEEPEYPHVMMEKSAKDPTEDIQEIFEDVIMRNLSTSKGISEEELLTLITEDLEQQFSDQLEDLLEDGEIEYSPTKGGLVKR